MSRNAERMTAELEALCYRTSHFKSPKEQGAAIGVQFEYRILDGSRGGQTVFLAVSVGDNEGEWPEVAPHWLYISPPDDVLAELVRGSENPGAIGSYVLDDGRRWMAISAPPSDFWDQIDTPNGKSMKTYLDRHVRRIWKMR